MFMKPETVKVYDEQRSIVAYLDGLPPSLRFGDAAQSALISSILHNVFKGKCKEMKFL